MKSAWRLMRQDAPRATLARIAEKAGVSRQALYLHFEGRAGLLVAMVRWVDERKALAERLKPFAELDDPVEELEGYVRTWLDYLPDLSPVAGFLAHARDDPEARVAWNDRMSALEGLYREPLSKLHRRAALRRGLPVNAAVDAIRAAASFHGWEHLVLDRGWSQLKAVDTLWNAARGAVLARSR